MQHNSLRKQARLDRLQGILLSRSSKYNYHRYIGKSMFTDLLGTVSTQVGYRFHAHSAAHDKFCTTPSHLF